MHIYIGKGLKTKVSTFYTCAVYRYITESVARLCMQGRHGHVHVYCPCKL